MKKWALVTGTTSGIGAAYCDLLAAEGYNLCLVSRDESRMIKQAQLLESKYGLRTKLAICDLSTSEGIQESIKCIEELGPLLEVVVNNAGFGLNSDFLTSAMMDQERMINCMVMAPMKITHSAANVMKPNQKGFIINVSSVASFMAGSTYCSAKSWLTVFSESVYQELRSNSINLHVICPGFTRTEFHMRCNQDVSGVPNFAWLTPEAVVKQSWKCVKKGTLIAIPGFWYKALVTMHRYAPRRILIIYGQIAKKYLRRGGKNTA
jgi:short-subunit dehydrogenase